MIRHFALLVAPLAAFLPSQHILHTYTVPFDRTVRSIRPVGDTNGDGVPDFVVVQVPAANTVFEIIIVSGVTGAPLLTLPGFGTNNWADAVGIGDVNLDGRSDFVVASTSLTCYSGATGAPLYSLPSPGNQGYMAVSDLGDFDGNGRPDFAVAAFSNGNAVITLRQGQSGAQLGVMPAIPTAETFFDLRRIGDLNGDNRQDLAFRSASSVHALRTQPAGQVWSINPPLGTWTMKMETIDLDGDGKYEVLYHVRPGTSGGFFNPARIDVYNGTNGLLRFAVNVVYGNAQDFLPAMCGVGDLDLDGIADFAVGVMAPPLNRVEVRSGATGRRLWSQPGTILAQPFGGNLATLGDVDADGFVDLVAGFGGNELPHGWTIVSGKILAESQPQGGACGGGPFFPQLGATRPILGQTMTIAGLNGPVGANGILAFSLQPAVPIYLGASTCAVWFDLPSAIVLYTTSQPQWSLPLPLPLLPQGAGYEIALQSFYGPTSGPLGFDLSNGVWARLGYQ